MNKVISSLWAKTDRNNDARWHPLILHLLDVAASADAILAREPESTRNRMAAILGMEWLESRPWLLLIIACHDLGKACPGFQSKWQDMTGLQLPRVSDPYQLHSTLCRAFSTPDNKCPESEFLWRQEPEMDVDGCPRILLQSRTMPDWTSIGVKGWLEHADAAIDLKERLKLDSLKTGQRFRFRLRANPCVSRNGKRQGLLQLEEQEVWLKRKGTLHGFSLPQLASFDFSESLRERLDVRVSQEQMLGGKQHSGNGIRIFSVLYDGMLTVTEPDKFRDALQSGIGHGKVMGLGLLSVVPAA